jgi:hypothetical protein
VGDSPLTLWQYLIRDTYRYPGRSLTTKARGVALTLALRMDTYSLETWMGVRLIVDESGWSESSVHAAIKELRDLGYLWVEYRGSGTKQQTNLYRGLFPSWARKPDGNEERYNERGF